MTNGDKIRKMTDEELAHIIMCPYDTVGDDITPIMPCLVINDITTAETCRKCTMEWLAKEALEPKPAPAWKKAFLNTFLGRN